MGKAKRNNSKFGRSDIPFRNRLLMDKFATVAGHRDHAARTAMKIATAALNDTEGLGYVRLVRFAHRQQELTELYYSEPDYQEAKLDQRLTEMGFTVQDGRLFGAVGEDGQPVKPKTWRTAHMDGQQLRLCPFCGAKTRMDTLPDVCTRLRCTSEECYVHHNPWYSWHNGNPEEKAVKRLIEWWNKTGGNNG